MIKFASISFLIYFAIQIITYLIGDIFVRHFLKVSLKNFFMDIFIRVTFGVILLTSVFAVIINSYRTIFVLTIPLLVFTIYSHRKYNRISFERTSYNFKLFLPILIVSALIFSVNFFLTTDSSSPFYLDLTQIDSDYIIYSKISKYFTIYNQENVFNVLNGVQPDYYNGIMLYHYFTEWLNSLVLIFSPLSSYSNYVLIIFPYFSFLVFLGVTAIISEFIESKYGILFLSLLSTGFLGSVVFLLKFFPKTENIGNLQATFYSTPKSYIVYILLMAFVVLFLKKYIQLAFFALIFIPLAYTTTLIGIVGGLLLFLVFIIWQKQINEYYFLIFLILIMFSGLLIFLSLNPTPPITREYSFYSPSYIISNFELKDLRTFINIIGMLHYGSFLLYIFPVLIIIPFWKTIFQNKEVLTLVLLLVGIHLASTIANGIFFKDINAIQLFRNIGIPVLNIAILVLLFFVYKRQSKQAKVFILIGMSIIFTANIFAAFNYVKYGVSIHITKDQIDNEYYSSIKKVIDENVIENKIGVTLQGRGDFENEWTLYLLNNSADFISQNVFAYNDNYITVNLSDFEKPVIYSDKLTEERAKSMTSLAYYKKYLETKVKSEDYPYKELPLNSFEHQAQYIHDKNVDYAIVSKTYLYWERLKQMGKLYFENKFTGEKFIIFDNNKK